jgi:tetratricopeptide (TPR) repeat protein
MPSSPPVTDASETQTRRPRSEIRLSKYTGPVPPPPVQLFRAHAEHGGELIWSAGDDAIAPLSLAPGPAGEAEICLGRADPRSARALVEESDVPADVARAVRARACLMSGDVAGAKKELGDDRDAAHFAVADAALSLAEGDVQRAARRVADALFTRPDGLAERYLFALVKVAEGDMQEAMVALSEVARSAPAHAVARYQLGQILLATGDPARAGTLFEMAWQLQPGFIAPALALAEMLADSRQYGEALALVGGITEASPDALGPRILQLRILLEVGEKETALALSTPLFAMQAGANGDGAVDPEVALLHAEALAENEKANDAKKVLDDVIGRPGADSASAQRARRQLARIALAETPPRSADAATLLKEAAKLGGPLVGELAIELFHVSIATGRRTDAEEALDIVFGEGDVGALISGAILARSHAMWPHARKLGEQAKTHVAGTPAEGQLEGFLATLPP